jgi:acyl-CoA synthetase (NDP forming)
MAEDFTPLFNPERIAVIGASASSGGVAANFLRNLRELGFAGRVWAVHPSATEMEGWPAVPSIAALPETVDYAYVSVAAARVPSLLRAAAGRIRFAQVISSGFAEAGEPALEAELVDACRAGGMRLLGPNCLGIYSSRARVSFISGVSMEPGGVAVLSQSGGLGADVLRRGQVRGLRFASLVTLGNAADLGAAELLRPLLDDPAVAVIGLYLEDIRDGRAFFETLRNANAAKPVVILKGGQTAAGQRASASHTGALAQDGRLWDALSAQTGAVLVETLDRFLDALLIFQCLRPRPTPTRSVVLFGNGGGTSVLATDAFSRAGFSVPALEGDVLDALQALRLPPGSSVLNPIDTPAGTLRQERGALGGRILALLSRAPGIDAAVVHLNMPVILAYADPEVLPNLIHGALAARLASGPHLAMVLRSDGELQIEAQRQEARASCLALGVPVYSELTDAAEAFRCLASHERFRSANL